MFDPLSSPYVIFSYVSCSPFFPPLLVLHCPLLPLHCFPLKGIGRCPFHVYPKQNLPWTAQAFLGCLWVCSMSFPLFSMAKSLSAFKISKESSIHSFMHSFKWIFTEDPLCASPVATRNSSDHGKDPGQPQPSPQEQCTPFFSVLIKFCTSV